VQRSPDVIDPLRDGRLCLTAIVELAKVITPENRAEVLPRFFHCSKREAKAVSAALAPHEAPPRRDAGTAIAVRACGAPPVQPSEALALPVRAETESQAVRPGEPISHESVTAPADVLPPFPPPRRDAAEPLTADLCRLHVTVSKRFPRKGRASSQIRGRCLRRRSPTTSPRT
jgi:hypothetical protein